MCTESLADSGRSASVLVLESLTYSWIDDSVLESFDISTKLSRSIRMTGFKAGAGVLLALAAAAAQAGPVLTVSTNATALAQALVGSGVTISNAVLTSDGAQAGTFTNAAGSVGFASGVALSTGVLSCAAGPNTSDFCTGAGTFTSLKFNFTSTTNALFFNYVFGSEEYNEFVGSQFNDEFQLLLDGVNIATLPSTTTGSSVVSINNVNCGANSSYYRNNSSGVTCANRNIDIGYDGLTTILQASATFAPGLHTFEFKVFDRGDDILDSGVFIQAGSFSVDPCAGGNCVPEPGSLALAGLGLFAAVSVRRRKSGS
jgi:hypothetical protein